MGTRKNGPREILALTISSRNGTAVRPTTSHIPNVRMEMIDCQLSVNGVHGPYGGHLSVLSRHIGCEAANNGGWGVSGWQHEYRNCISHEPELPGFRRGPPKIPRRGSQATVKSMRAMSCSKMRQDGGSTTSPAITTVMCGRAESWYNRVSWSRKSSRLYLRKL